MAEYVIRPAISEDNLSIRKLVRQAKINPTGLHWQRFLVAQTPENDIVACGQVKIHRGDVRELASIAVTPDFRGGGIASAIILKLINSNPKPLFLMCRSSLGSFYAKFDFKSVLHDAMPAYFRRVSTLARIFSILDNGRDTLLVMRRD